MDDFADNIKARTDKITTHTMKILNETLGKMNQMIADKKERDHTAQKQLAQSRKS